MLSRILFILLAVSTPLGLSGCAGLTREDGRAILGSVGAVAELVRTIDPDGSAGKIAGLVSDAAARALEAQLAAKFDAMSKALKADRADARVKMEEFITASTAAGVQTTREALAVYRKPGEEPGELEGILTDAGTSATGTGAAIAIALALMRKRLPPKNGGVGGSGIPAALPPGSVITVPEATA